GLDSVKDADGSVIREAPLAEFHCSRKFIAAARAGMFGLRTHPNHPSAANSTEQQHHARTERCESGQHRAWQTVVLLQKQSRVALSYRVKSRFETRFLPLMSCGRLVLNEPRHRRRLKRHCH